MTYLPLVDVVSKSQGLKSAGGPPEVIVNLDFITSDGAWQTNNGEKAVVVKLSRLLGKRSTYKLWLKSIVESLAVSMRYQKKLLYK